MPKIEFFAIHKPWLYQVIQNEPKVLIITFWSPTISTEGDVIRAYLSIFFARNAVQGQMSFGDIFKQINIHSHNPKAWRCCWTIDCRRDVLSNFRHLHWRKTAKVRSNNSLRGTTFFSYTYVNVFNMIVILYIPSDISKMKISENRHAFTYIILGAVLYKLFYWNVYIYIRQKSTALHHLLMFSVSKCT